MQARTINGYEVLRSFIMYKHGAKVHYSVILVDGEKRAVLTEELRKGRLTSLAMEEVANKDKKFVEEPSTVKIYDIRNSETGELIAEEEEVILSDKETLEGGKIILKDKEEVVEEKKAPKKPVKKASPKKATKKEKKD